MVEHGDKLKEDEVDPIGFVVRNMTGETQLSIRFLLRQHARTFAEQCAMPVRVWRVVRKTKTTEPAAESRVSQAKDVGCPDCEAVFVTFAEMKAHAASEHAA